MANVSALPTAHIPSPRPSPEPLDPSDRYAPSEFEIAHVSAGRDSDLVDAAFEERDPNPITAAHQDRRDRLALLGRWEDARDEHQQVLDMRGAQLALDLALARGEGRRGPYRSRRLEQVHDPVTDVPAPDIDVDDDLDDDLELA